MYKAKGFKDALDKADRLIADGGFGHTAALYVNPVTEREKIDEFGARMKTCRILVNTPSSQGGIGDLYNFKLAPSLTLGCGGGAATRCPRTWASSIWSTSKQSPRGEKTCSWFRTPSKVYIKKGCLPVALDELKSVMGKKKAFIVTDSFLYNNGYTKGITDKLDEMDIKLYHFLQRRTRPVPCQREGRRQADGRLRARLIIAVGGGSAIDAAKIMWLMYEHPEVDFVDMAMRFMDIRKRMYTFPKMGEKADSSPCRPLREPAAK